MIKIAVTGVGGGVGQSILKAAQDAPCEVVKIDTDPLATGLYTSGTSYLGEAFIEEEAFVERIIEICRAEKCDLLFPGVEGELRVLSKHQQRIKAEAGTLVVVSSPEVIDIADDKLATSSFLQQNGFPFPRTTPLAHYQEFDSFPAVLKPRRGGAGSRGVYLADAPPDCQRLIEMHELRLDNYVIQERIEGDEFTCGAIYLDGVVGVIPIRRTLRNGDTYKAFVTRDPGIQAFIAEVAAKLKPFGPCNFQLRRRDNQLIIFEINARCSGTTAIRARSGFNDVMTSTNLLLGTGPAQVDFRELTVLRYWQELVIENELIETLKQSRSQRLSKGRL